MKQLGLVFFLILLLSCSAEKKQVSTLHYSLTGTGDTTLVFVHGWGIDGDYWAPQVEFFSPSYKVLTLDLQGHGQSPSKNTSMTVEKYADDIVQLLIELDLDDVVLVGHSMSGNINLHVYDRIPQRIIGFIGVDNLQTAGQQPAHTKEASQQFFSEYRKNYEEFTRRYALSSLFAPETDTLVKARVISDLLELDAEFSISTLEAVTDEYVSERATLPKLDFPLLLIVAHGSMPEVTYHQKFLSKGYNVWTYNKAGHYPMIEIPGEFNRLLAEAIRYKESQG